MKPTKYFEMDGLGPNIGSEMWKQKISLRKDMLYFGEQVSKHNMERLVLCPKRTVSSKRASKREKAIEYANSLKAMAYENIRMMLSGHNKYGSNKNEELNT